MKQLCLISLLIVITLLTHSVVAQIIRHPMQKDFSYEVSAQRIGSGDIIEFTPMNIKWGLAVKVTPGIGSEPIPTDISICPEIMSPDFHCAVIHNARPGLAYNGSLSVPAPPAGKQSSLRIAALKQPPKGEFPQYVVSETSVKVAVAARYDVSLASFNLLTTRSNSTDTVWITFEGLVNSIPQHPSANSDACHLAGFNWCIFNQSYGDVHNSGVRPLNNVRVGPFDLVPEREKDLRILFYIDNHSTDLSAEKAAAVGNAFSKVGMVILSAYGYKEVATQLDNVMEGLHSVATGSCDGKLAEDFIIIPNTTVANQPQNTLDSFTRTNGRYITAVLNNGVPKIYLEFDHDFVCDRRGGQYNVTYAIYRTSWRDWGFRPQW